MTDMIQIDRGQLVDAFAEFLAAAEPAGDSAQSIDASTVHQLAEKARELVTSGAFRSKTAAAETQARLLREGYRHAEMIAISEIGFQIARAVNSAFMNAAGVYSSSVKMHNALLQEIDAANDDENEDGWETPAISDDEIDANMKADGFYWDDESKSYVDINYRAFPAENIHGGVAAAIDRVTKKYNLAS